MARLVQSDRSPLIPLEDHLRMEHSMRHPGFRGVVVFPIVFMVLGERVERKAMVEFSETPAWEYFDLHLQKLHVGAEMRSIQLSILAEPEHGTKRERKPKWLLLDLLDDGVLSEAVWDQVGELIDAECRKLDAARRNGDTSGKAETIAMIKQYAKAAL